MRRRIHFSAVLVLVLAALLIVYRPHPVGARAFRHSDQASVLLATKGPRPDEPGDDDGGKEPRPDEPGGDDDKGPRPDESNPVPTPTQKPNAPPPPPPPTPTPTPTSTPTPIPPTPVPTATPSPTPTPTSTPTPPPTPTASPTPLPFVSGVIFHDKNDNGVQDADEPGIGGVAIKLDDRVIGVTDSNGRFVIQMPRGGGKGLLSIVAPSGWQWVGEPISAGDVAASGINLSISMRQEEAAVSPAATATATGVLVLVLAGGMVFLGIAMLTQTAAVHSLRQTYRRDKGMELELRQERQINERKAEVAVLLREEDGWKQVIGQLLADALPGSSARMAQAEVLELAADPAPRFTVADPEGKAFLFTTSPKTLRRVKMLTRRERPVPLDAAVHPAARAEVQAVWEHLAAQFLRGESDAPVLPRQSEWFLVEREAKRKGR